MAYCFPLRTAAVSRHGVLLQQVLLLSLARSPWNSYIRQHIHTIEKDPAYTGHKRRAGELQWQDRKLARIQRCFKPILFRRHHWARDREEIIRYRVISNTPFTSS